MCHFVSFFTKIFNKKIVNCDFLELYVKDKWIPMQYFFTKNPGDRRGGCLYFVSYQHNYKMVEKIILEENDSVKKLRYFEIWNDRKEITQYYIYRSEFTLDI